MGFNLGRGNGGRRQTSPRSTVWLSGALAVVLTAGCDVPGLSQDPENDSLPLSGTNLSGTNLSGTNLSGTGLSGSNLSGSGLDGRGSSVLLNGEDLGLTRGSRCVERGIATTAFAKLLGQQSETSRISVALGKLPPGTSSEVGAAAGLETWKAVVRGDRTACTFVLAAPPQTTWTAVAGFIKAIFRWNAPITQVVDISGLTASAPHDPTMGTRTLSYTGMRDAAARWRSGQITGRNFLAGELAFITATTNNRSVLVDFATWVMDSSGRGLILGHVDSFDPPTFAESVYYAYENDDGSIGVAVGPASALPGTGRYSNKVASSYETLEAAYRFYQAGTLPRPIPTRCGGALFLNAVFGEPVRSGKCDSGLRWTTGEASGYRGWNTESGTTAPMNDYMLLPADGSSGLQRNGKRVLSETYVHMWEPNYEYAATLDAPGLRDKGFLAPAETELVLAGFNQ
jgi:hypothetical protein